MQDYSNPKGRNSSVAVGRPVGRPKGGSASVSIAAGRVGGNAMQGAGTLPNKVAVPLPGTNETQAPYKGGMRKAPVGFNAALISGKVD